MVYTLTPSDWAASAAVSGGTLPALFCPSVSKITIRLLDFRSRKRFTAALKPAPMAVPCSPNTSMRSMCRRRKS